MVPMPPTALGEALGARSCMALAIKAAEAKAGTKAERPGDIEKEGEEKGAGRGAVEVANAEVSGVTRKLARFVADVRSLPTVGL